MSKCLKCLNFRSAHPSWYHTQSSNSILLKTAVLLAAGTSLGCLLQPSTRGLLRVRSLRSTVLVFTFSNHSSACSCPADWGKEKVLINMACKRRVQLSSGKEATSFYPGSNPKAHSPGNLTAFLEQSQVICPQHKGCPAKGELGYAILSLSLRARPRCTEQAAGAAPGPREAASHSSPGGTISGMSHFNHTWHLCTLQRGHPGESQAPSEAGPK